MAEPEPRTVLHGVDMSVDAYARLQDGNMGSQCLAEDVNSQWLYDSSDKAWLPGRDDYIAAKYDFDSDGGSIGEIELSAAIPDNTVVLDGFIEILDPLVSSGAVELQFKGESADDIKAATNMQAEGLYDIIPDGTATNMFRTTAERTVIMTVSVAAITSGSLIVFLRVARGFDS